jgi:hypothetical protein
MANPFHSHSESVPFYICFSLHLCFILPVLSQAYTYIISVAYHVVKFTYLYTKALMFVGNVLLESDSPLNSTMTLSTARHLDGL